MQKELIRNSQGASSSVLAAMVTTLAVTTLGVTTISKSVDHAIVGNASSDGDSQGSQGPLNMYSEAEGDSDSDDGSEYNHERYFSQHHMTGGLLEGVSFENDLGKFRVTFGPDTARVTGTTLYGKQLDVDGIALPDGLFSRGFTNKAVADVMAAIERDPVPFRRSDGDRDKSLDINFEKIREASKGLSPRSQKRLEALLQPLEQDDAFPRWVSRASNEAQELENLLSLAFVDEQELTKNVEIDRGELFSLVQSAIEPSLSEPARNTPDTDVSLSGPSVAVDRLTQAQPVVTHQRTPGGAVETYDPPGPEWLSMRREENGAYKEATVTTPSGGRVSVEFRDNGRADVEYHPLGPPYRSVEEVRNVSLPGVDVVRERPMVINPVSFLSGLSNIVGAEPFPLQVPILAPARQEPLVPSAMTRGGPQ